MDFTWPIAATLVTAFLSISGVIIAAIIKDIGSKEKTVSKEEIGQPLHNICTQHSGMVEAISTLKQGQKEQKELLEQILWTLKKDHL